jgi:hypothetical protein
VAPVSTMAKGRFFVDRVVASDLLLIDVKTAPNCQSQWHQVVLLPCMLA